MCAHLLARWSSLPLVSLLPYVREEGTGKPVAESVTGPRLLLASLMTLLPIALLAPAALVPLLLVTGGVTAVFGWLCVRQIGGITGDALGAANQLVEVSIYLYFAASLAH